MNPYSTMARRYGAMQEYEEDKGLSLDPTTLAPPREPLGTRMVEGASQAIQTTKDTAKDIWDNHSWLGSGLRQLIPRVMNPAWDWDAEERKDIVEKELGKYNLSPEEKRIYVQTGDLPTEIQRELDREKEERESMPLREKLKPILNYITSEPMEFAKDLGKGILGDPYLLAFNAPYQTTYKALTTTAPKSLSKQALTSAAKTAPVGHKTAIAASMGAEAGVGAGLFAAGEAAVSREQEGAINWDRVKAGAGMGAAFATPFAIGMAVGSHLRKVGQLAATKSKMGSEQVQAEIIYYAKANKTSLQKATEEVFVRYGLDPADAVEELNRARSKVEQALGKDYGQTPAPTTTQYPTPQAGAHMRATGDMASTRGLGGAASRAESLEGSPHMLREKELDAKEASIYEARKELDTIKREYQEDVDRIAVKERELSTDFSSLGREIERIARKERDAAYPTHPSESIAKELYTSSAFRPSKDALIDPPLTMREFASTPLGRSSRGKPLAGATLKARYDKWLKDLQAANRDMDQIVTLRELEEIMTDMAPNMRKFFLEQGRKKRTRKTQIPKKYRGSADNRLLEVLGAAGIAALMGYAVNNNWQDAVKYAVIVTGGLVGGAKLLRYISKRHPVLSHVTTTDKNVKLDDLYAKWQGAGAEFERRVKGKQHAMWVASGGKFQGAALREQVTHALEDPTGKLLAKLSPEGKELYKMANTFLDDAKKFAQDRGLELDWVEYYVPHLWQHPTKSTDELLEAMFEGKSGKAALQSIHENTRKLPTYKLGISKGYKPRTLDIADIIPIYLKSMDSAARNRELFSTLKKTKNPITNKPLIMGAKTAPKGYKAISHPKFNGFLVDPEARPAIKAMFSATDFGSLERAALGLNFLLKRQAVSISGFHAKALLMSYMMAGGLAKGLRHPIRSTKDMITFFRGKSPAYHTIYNAADDGTKDMLDQGLRNGLILDTVDDVGSDTFYQFLDDVSGSASSAYERAVGAMGGGRLGAVAASPIKALEKSVKGLKTVNRFVDGLMWDYIYSTLKTSTYLDKMSHLTSKHKDVPIDELSKIAAEFTNDAFGGLNWLRIAENVENKYGSTLAYEVFGKRGRAMMQLGMFAPDWTLANIRVWTKGWTGKNPIQKQLYRRYVYNGLFMFTGLAEGINYALTGKHLWENQDPGTIEFGDGRRISLSKQFYEPAKWVWKPWQSAINKTSSLVKIGTELATGQQYLRHGAMGPPIESYLDYAGKKISPIWLNNARDYGLGQGMASMAGFPVYGKPSLKTLGRTEGGRGGGSGRYGGSR